MATAGRPLTAQPQSPMQLLLVQGLTYRWPSPDHSVIADGSRAALPNCFETTCSPSLRSASGSLKPGRAELDHMSSRAAWFRATDQRPLGAWRPMLLLLLDKNGRCFRHDLFEPPGRVHLLVSYPHSRLPNGPVGGNSRLDRSLSLPFPFFLPLFHRRQTLAQGRRLCPRVV